MEEWRDLSYNTKAARFFEPYDTRTTLATLDKPCQVLSLPLAAVNSLFPEISLPLSRSSFAQDIPTNPLGAALQEAHDGATEKIRRFSAILEFKRLR